MEKVELFPLIPEKVKLNPGDSWKTRESRKKHYYISPFGIRNDGKN